MTRNMRLQVFDMTDILTAFCTGITKCLGLLSGSGIAMFVAQALPDEQSVIKAASAVTGWVLAVSCIYVLAKTVKVLFERMESQRKEHADALKSKDEIIAELHETAVQKADAQRLEMLNELKSINRNVQK